MKRVDRLWPIFVLWLVLFGWIGLTMIVSAEVTESNRGTFLIYLIYLLAVPGPPLIGARRWQGASSLVIPAAFPLLGLAGLLFGYIKVDSAQTGSLLLGVVYAQAAGISLAAASGMLLGLVFLALLFHRGACPTCNSAIRLWQSSMACRTHPGDSTPTFHSKCLFALKDEVFLSHERACLDHLVDLSRGARPLEQDLRGTRSICSSCLRDLAREALHLHLQHSDFLVPKEEINRKQVLCGHCGHPAPTSPDDCEPIEIVVHLGGSHDANGAASIERYRLGPMVRCPHCGAAMHLMCWISHGGCINHGSADARGKICSMGGRSEQAATYAAKGWPRLCTDHASRAGWEVRGHRHQPISMPVIGVKRSR